MAMPSALFTDFKRLSLVFFFLVFTALTVLPGYCDTLESITFDSRWPDTSPRNILAGEASSLLFYGAGATLALIRPGTHATDSMVEISRIKLEVTRGITGLGRDNSGNVIFAACGNKGLAIVDVSDVSAPVLVKTIGLDPDKRTIHASALDVFDSRLYLADVYFGLRVFDVSNPTNPTQAGTYEQVSTYTDSEGNPGSYSGGHINLRVAEINHTKYAFVLDKYYGLRVFDVSIDSAPALVGQFDMRSKQLYGQLSVVVDLAVDQHFLYISDATNGITILDLFSNPDSPTTIETTKKGQIATPGAASGVTLSTDTLYVADGNSGLLVVDVSDRANPTAVFTHDANGAYGVVEMGETLFLADTVDGITRLGKTAETDLVKTGSFDAPSGVDAIFADATHAYLLDKNGPREGVTIISVSDTGEYYFTGAVATPGNATQIYASDEKAYVADGSAGITIIDIQNKVAPILAGTFNPGGNACDILVHTFDNRAFIADKTFGLVIADVTDQGLLTQKAALYMENAQALAYVEQDRSYLLVVNQEGLYTVDISDPESPVVAGYIKTPGQALDVGVKDNYAVVADGENGVVLIDISDPANPAITATHDTPGQSTALFIQQSYVHVADGTNGLQILGIVASDPAELVEITSYETPGQASGVWVSGNDSKRYTYLADGWGGFLSFVHSNVLSGGIDEKPFTDSPDDTGWDRADGGCFISTLF